MDTAWSEGVDGGSVLARPGRSFRAADRRWLLSLGGSVALHFATLLACHYAPPPRACLCLGPLGDSAAHRWIRASLPAPPAPTPLEPWLWPRGEAGAVEGDEGRARAVRPPSTGHVRRAVPGASRPSAARLTGGAVEREAPAALARTAGILAVLAAGDGPGPGLGVGQSPLAAGPPGFALTLAGALGDEGFGLVGTGRGGGGEALGTVGTGGTSRRLVGSSYGRSFGTLTRERREKLPVIRACVAVPWTPPQRCVVVRGRMSSEVIRRVVRSHVNEVRWCYERALVGRPDLSGRVSVRFTIAPTGAVEAARTATSTLAHAETEECVLRAVRRWKFPPPDAGAGSTEVSYPFVLQPVEE